VSDGVAVSPPLTVAPTDLKQIVDAVRIGLDAM